MAATTVKRAMAGAAGTATKQPKARSGPRASPSNTNTAPTRAQPLPGMPKAADFRKCAAQVSHLSDGTRLQIFWVLDQGPRNVGELCEIAGITQPAMSHHLKLLRTAGFVEATRDGKSQIYAMTDQGRELWGGVSEILT